MKYKNGTKIMFGILFALSSVMLSFQLLVGGDTNDMSTVEYEKDIIIITSIISFCCAMYFWQKTSDEAFKNMKNNKKLTLLYIILSFIVWGRLYSI